MQDMSGHSLGSNFGAQTGQNAGGFDWKGALGGMLPGIGNIIGGFMGMNQYQNPGNAMMPYLSGMTSGAGQYLNPYMQAGQGAMNTLQGQYGQLLQNPGQMLNNMGQSFQQSPGYQFQLGQGMNAANQAASAGGMLGSPQHQQQAQQVGQGIANQDYYNWLNRTMGMYGQGLSGMQGINQMGYGASNQMANIAQQQAMMQAMAAQMGAQGNNANQGAGFGSMLSGLGSAAGAILPFL